MSAETLRKAAALMRERAEAATEVWQPSRWRSVLAADRYERGMRTSDLDRHHVATDDEHGSILLTSPWDETQVVDHAASWHPVVALAVADWLWVIASYFEHGGHSEAWEPYEAALKVATAYLGADA